MEIQAKSLYDFFSRERNMSSNILVERFKQRYRKEKTNEISDELYSQDVENTGVILNLTM